MSLSRMAFEAIGAVDEAELLLLWKDLRVVVVSKQVLKAPKKNGLIEFHCFGTLLFTHVKYDNQAAAGPLRELANVMYAIS